jgi:4-amino-4-deoxy-L-arabinose transferase-like glycosyltransferase
MSEAHLSRRAWISAGLVVTFAGVLRLAYLWTIPWRGGNLIVLDPDEYTVNGLRLATHHFAAAALYHSVAVYQFVKPPLYTIALALVSLIPGDYPRHAAVFQALMGGAMVFAVFWIGYRVHSPGAGIAAAALAAVYMPFAADANVFVQESLYIPLLTIAFAALVEVSARGAPPGAWALAGAVFGLAALTRSMPLYYLPPALAMHVWRSDDRARGLRQAGACLLAFAVLIAPYSIAISRHVHQIVLVENMGAISFPMRYPDARNAVHHTAPPPTVVETAGMLLRAFAASPIGFTGERIDDALTLVRLRGGRTVQSLEGLETAAGARVHKAAVDIFDDGLFAVVCVLAPLGWALARARREAAFVGGWVVLNVLLLAAFTFTGARYRLPVVPSLMVLSGVVLAGRWQRPSRTAIAAAAIVSGTAAYAIAGSVPSVIAGRAEYGVHAPRTDSVTRHVEALGAIGLNEQPVDGAVTATVGLPADLPAAEMPVRIDVQIDGVPLESWTLAAGATHDIRYLRPHPTAAYVELHAVGATGHPAPFIVEMPVVHH